MRKRSKSRSTIYSVPLPGRRAIDHGIGTRDIRGVNRRKTFGTESPGSEEDSTKHKHSLSESRGVIFWFAYEFGPQLSLYILILRLSRIWLAPRDVYKPCLVVNNLAYFATQVLYHFSETMTPESMTPAN
jgi:hypothetical protein